MELFIAFINEYGTMILYAIIVAVGGWLGTQIKSIYEQHVTDKRARDVVETVVKAVEQLYHDLEGPEKYCKAIDAAEEMLAAKGITISGLELEMLIEAAVSSFNYGFGGKKVTTPAADGGTLSTAQAAHCAERAQVERRDLDGTEAETGTQE